MQTHFTADQLADPQIAEADAILRKCVHCGFCTATCPTFVITGDERDSPRGLKINKGHSTYSLTRPCTDVCNLHSCGMNYIHPHYRTWVSN